MFRSCNPTNQVDDLSDSDAESKKKAKREANAILHEHTRIYRHIHETQRNTSISLFLSALSAVDVCAMKYIISTTEEMYS